LDKTITEAKARAKIISMKIGKYSLNMF